MAATGSIEIEGKSYTWTSPRLRDLMQFEGIHGSISDPAVVNSVKGRCGLMEICLREKHPEITLGLISDWPADAWNTIWDVIRQALPLWAGSPPAAGSPEISAPPSSGSPDGPPAAPSTND